MTLSTYPISNGLPAFNLGPSFLAYAIQREMKMASIKENLIAAKALIDTPEKWIKGNITNADDTCFCAFGALGYSLGAWMSVSDELGEQALTDAIPASFVRPGFRHPIAEFNDDPATTHADIMALFDRAIAAQDEVA